MIPFKIVYMESFSISRPNKKRLSRTFETASFHSEERVHLFEKVNDAEEPFVQSLPPGTSNSTIFPSLCFRLCIAVTTIFVNPGPCQ